MISSVFQPRWAWWAATGLLMVFWVGSVRADVPPPPKSRTSTVHVAPGWTGAPRVPFVIRNGADQQYSRIVIPRKFLPVAAPAKAAGPGAAAGLERRSISAGIVLSLVIAGGFLALVFVRRRKGGWAAAGAATLLAAVVVLGSTALADLAVPGRTRPRVTPPTQASPNAPQIIVETTDSGDQIVLILGKTAPQYPK